MDLRRFCREIKLPPEAVKIVEKMDGQISELQYVYVRNGFWTDRQKIFKEIAASSGYRQRFLYYYCRLACETFEKYQKAGIGEKVFFDTFSDFTIWCRVCFRRYGEYGLQEYEWLWRHVEMTIFRLGRLQFEKTPSPWAVQTKDKKRENRRANNQYPYSRGRAVGWETVQRIHYPGTKVLGKRPSLCMPFLASVSRLKKTSG